MGTVLDDDVLEAMASELVHAVLDSTRSALGYEVPNIAWVSCRDFTIQRGQAQIEEYMRTWEMHPSWLFSVHFLQERELDFQRQFLYKAVWSIPTSRTPIPRSTAAVHFIIEVSTKPPQTLPVRVRFLVESNRTVHTPGETRFREKWLKDVIESKALLFDTIDF